MPSCRLQLLRALSGKMGRSLNQGIYVYIYIYIFFFYLFILFFFKGLGFRVRPLKEYGSVT